MNTTVIDEKKEERRKELEEKLEPYDFWDIFRLDNGRLEPRRILNINGVIFGPGVYIHRDAKIRGVDLFEYKSCKFGSIEEDNGVLKLMTVYSPEQNEEVA